MMSNESLRLKAGSHTKLRAIIDNNNMFPNGTPTVSLHIILVIDDV